MKKIKVAHLTSVHPRYDARIFLKMCCSLAIRNFNIYLVVADGRGNEKKNNVNIRTKLIAILLKQLLLTSITLYL